MLGKLSVHIYGFLSNDRLSPPLLSNTRLDMENSTLKSSTHIKYRVDDFNVPKQCFFIA